MSRDLVNTSAPMRRDPLALANRHAERAAEQLRAAYMKVHGPVDDLFGHPVAEALLPFIENGQENAGEAFYHFRMALDEQAERLGATRRELANALQLLRVGAEETAARFAKARKPAPDWVGRALGATRGPQAQEEAPF